MAWDEEAIRSLFEQVVRGWNEKDANMIGAAFAPEGMLVGYDGGEVFGQVEIARFMSGVFRDHEVGRWTRVIRGVSFPVDDIGVLHAVSGWVQPNYTAEPFPKAVQLMTAVRMDDGWRIATLQSTPAQYHGFPDKVEALEAELRGAS